MNELKIIENKLVPVYETDTGEKVVYGTELHDSLDVKSNYREWVGRRFSECDAIESTDYSFVEISTKGRPSSCALFITSAPSVFLVKCSNSDIFFLIKSSFCSLFPIVSRRSFKISITLLL